MDSEEKNNRQKHYIKSHDSHHIKIDSINSIIKNMRQITYRGGSFFAFFDDRTIPFLVNFPFSMLCNFHTNRSIDRFAFWPLVDTKWYDIRLSSRFVLSILSMTVERTAYFFLSIESFDSSFSILFVWLGKSSSSNRRSLSFPAVVWSLRRHPSSSCSTTLPGTLRLFRPSLGLLPRFLRL
jgi:hypothetical protein